jgi:hypothetical protein
MRKKKLTADEKGLKVNEQRFALIVLLCNVLDTENGVSDKIKSAICSSLINVMEQSFIPKDDDVFANLINNSIDVFCFSMEEKHGIENYREHLMESVITARKLVDELNKKVQRIKEGEDILKGICLN